VADQAATAGRARDACDRCLSRPLLLPRGTPELWACSSVETDMKRTLFIAAAALAAIVVSSAYGAKPDPKNITIGATPTTVKFGGSVTLAGKLTGANNSGRPVTVEQDPFPVDNFTNAGTATTNASGDWSLVLKPDKNTRYRARSGNAVSKTLDVNVRPAISLKLSDRTPAAGTRVRFFGRLCPEHDGVAIALQRRVAPNQWRTLRSPVLKDIPGSTCSSYSKRLRVRRDGTFRTHFLGDSEFVAGNSRAKRVNVH